MVYCSTRCVIFCSHFNFVEFGADTCASIDPSLLVLGVTQTCFEGSMYIFVFLWVPFLQEAPSLYGFDLPLGYIFSAFMVSMMIGSLVYSAIVSHSRTDSPTADAPLVLHAKLSSLVCLVAALSLAWSVMAVSAEERFWAFCVFEACVGIYYPVQGMLKGTLISNDHRATVSFVILASIPIINSRPRFLINASSLLYSEYPSISSSHSPCLPVSLKTANSFSPPAQSFSLFQVSSPLSLLLDVLLKPQLFGLLLHQALLHRYEKLFLHHGFHTLHFDCCCFRGIIVQSSCYLHTSLWTLFKNTPWCTGFFVVPREPN